MLFALEACEEFQLVHDHGKRAVWWRVDGCLVPALASKQKGVCGLWALDLLGGCGREQSVTASLLAGGDAAQPPLPERGDFLDDGVMSEKQLLQLHQRLGHPTSERFIRFLEDAKGKAAVKPFYEFIKDHVVYLTHGGRVIHVHPDDALAVRERVAADPNIQGAHHHVEAAWRELPLGAIMNAASPVVTSMSLGMAKVNRTCCAKLLGARQVETSVLRHGSNLTIGRKADWVVVIQCDVIECDLESGVLVSAASGKPLKGRKELSREECTRYADLIVRSMDAELEKISARGVWGDPETSSPKGAILMSGKWVHTWKVCPDEAQRGAEPVVKSRFCMKGFQDPRRGLRTDSATASATAQRAVLAHAAINGNPIVSIDIELFLPRKNHAMLSVSIKACSLTGEVRSCVAYVIRLSPRNFWCCVVASQQARGMP
eukprot:gene17762-biopygen30675